MSAGAETSTASRNSLSFIISQALRIGPQLAVIGSSQQVESAKTTRRRIDPAKPGYLAPSGVYRPVLSASIPTAVSSTVLSRSGPKSPCRSMAETAFVLAYQFPSR